MPPHRRSAGRGADRRQRATGGAGGKAPEPDVLFTPPAVNTCSCEQGAGRQSQTSSLATRARSKSTTELRAPEMTRERSVKRRGARARQSGELRAPA